MNVLVTGKIEEDSIKNKGATVECPQHFSHYKSMRLFQDAQGQLLTVEVPTVERRRTPLCSVVGSEQISNLSESLWLSSLIFMIPNKYPFLVSATSIHFVCGRTHTRTLASVLSLSSLCEPSAQVN